MKNLSKFELKKLIVDMVVDGGDGHIPSAFSIFEIIYVLYHQVLNLGASNVLADTRDYFILSKGHGCLALYVNLYDIGILTEDDLRGFCKSGGILGEHPDMTKVPGAEASTGSLGHGLSFACGISFGLKKRGMSNRVYVLVGDGECHEGSVWEAANIATNLHLTNLTVVVDLNESAQQLLKIDRHAEKWRSFGWNVIEVADGNDSRGVYEALSRASEIDGPTAIVAKTVKGKGAPMIEGHGPWHHKIPNAVEYKQLIEELRRES